MPGLVDETTNWTKDFTDSANLNFIFQCDAFEFKFDIKNYSMDLQGLDERYHSVRFRSFPFYHQKSIIDNLWDSELLDFEWLQLQPMQICWFLDRIESQ